MLNKKFMKARRKKSALSRAFCFLLLTSVIFCGVIDFTLSRNAESAIGFACKKLVTKILAEEVSNCLADENIEYNSLCNVLTDGGKISFVEINVREVNKINASLLQRVTRRLDEAGENKFYIPLGSLMGSSLLLGRGPRVAIKFYPSGYIKTKAKNSFEEAGVNQTNHRVTLDLSVEVTAFLFFHSETYQVNEEFLITEMLIVGDVPEYYTNIISEDEKLVSDIRDEMPDIK